MSFDVPPQEVSSLTHCWGSTSTETSHGLSAKRGRRGKWRGRGEVGEEREKGIGYLSTARPKRSDRREQVWPRGKALGW